MVVGRFYYSFFHQVDLQHTHSQLSWFDEFLGQKQLKSSACCGQGLNPRPRDLQANSLITGSLARKKFEMISFMFLSVILQEIKDTLDKEAIYRCLASCYESCQVISLFVSFVFNSVLLFENFDSGILDWGLLQMAATCISIATLCTIISWIYFIHREYKIFYGSNSQQYSAFCKY